MVLNPETLKKPAASAPAQGRALGGAAVLGDLPPGTLTFRVLTLQNPVISGISPRRDAPLAAQLFVGDLPPGTGAAELQALLGQVAPVTGARVPPGAAYGFVSFASEEDASFALQAAETSGLYAPDGQLLRVSRAGAPRMDHQQVRAAGGGCM